MGRDDKREAVIEAEGNAEKGFREGRIDAGRVVEIQRG